MSPHTHRHTEGLVCWCYYTPFHWVLLCHVIDCLYLCHTWTTLFIPVSYGFCLYTSHGFFCLYQSYVFLFIPVFVYTIHQRPRGGERLAGRYNAEEHLRRLLRAGRCAGRVRSVGTSREGRGSSRCRAAGSGRAAASTRCRYLDVVGVVAGGRQFLSLAGTLSCTP